MAKGRMYYDHPSMKDQELAAALGRLSQANSHLEFQLQLTLTNLLPLTTEMGRVLFAGNQQRRNIEILRALLLLPDIPISDDERAELTDLIPRLVVANDHRSRFLHNPIIGGTDGSYHLSQDRQDGKGGTSYPITVPLILECAEETDLLIGDLIIPPVEYDLSTWAPAMDTSSTPKQYPKDGAPKPPPLPPPERSGPQR